MRAFGGRDVCISTIHNIQNKIHTYSFNVEVLTKIKSVFTMAYI